MDPSLTHAYRADSVAVSIRLDTEDGECINTVDAIVKYDPNITAVDVSRGDSILSLWVEDPKIDPVARKGNGDSLARIGLTPHGQGFARLQDGMVLK